MWNGIWVTTIMWFSHFYWMSKKIWSLLACCSSLFCLDLSLLFLDIDNCQLVFMPIYCHYPLCNKTFSLIVPMNSQFVMQPPQISWASIQISAHLWEYWLKFVQIIIMYAQTLKLSCFMLNSFFPFQRFINYSQDFLFESSTAPTSATK